MSKQDRSSGLDRRQFLTRVSGGTLGAVVGASLVKYAQAAEAQIEKRNEQPDMVYRPFGKTGLNVSRVSYGCLRLQDDNLAGLDAAVERGLNLVHIADNYNRGQSIKSLAKFLEKKRDKVWVALKGTHGSGLEVEKIDANLKTLGIDGVDVICAPIFAPDEIRKSEKQLETFEALKKAGKVRFLNLTTHTEPQAGMEAGIDAGCYTSVLSVVNLSNVENFKPTIQKANKASVGIMAMKSAGNAKGRSADEIAAALLPAGVDTILKSLVTLKDVDEWFAAASKAGKLAQAGPAASLVADSGICTLCGICTGCPNGVAVPDIVRDYTYYYEQQGLPEIWAERYAEIPAAATVASCGDCGRCEELCPMKVPTRRIIREAHARMA